MSELTPAATVVVRWRAVDNRPDKDPGVFLQHITVDDSDVDELGHVSNVAYLRWVQNVARAHSVDAGYDVEQYKQLGVVFVVRRHELDYLRPAYAGDDIEVKTWVGKWTAATSVRHTHLVRRSDEVELLRGVTTWALVSTEDGRPRRITRELRVAFGLESRPPA